MICSSTRVYSFPLDYCLELAVFFNMVMVNMLDELCRRGLGPQGKSWKWDHLIQQDWTWGPYCTCPASPHSSFSHKGWVWLSPALFWRPRMVTMAAWTYPSVTKFDYSILRPDHHSLLIRFSADTFYISSRCSAWNISSYRVLEMGRHFLSALSFLG